MRKDIVSIVAGAAAVALSFTPSIWLQLFGACVGVAGILLARRARREDYRRDLTCTVGFVASVVGVVLCLLTPVVFAVGSMVLSVAG